MTSEVHMNQSDLMSFRKQFYQDSAIAKLDKDQINKIRTLYKDDVKHLLKKADDVLENKFMFTGKWNMEKTWTPHVFEQEIQWDFTPNGDLEWTFVLNRHEFLLELGRAFYFTDDYKYVKGFESLINDWIDHNPLNEETVHSSWRSIEAGIRCANWVESLTYVICELSDETLLKVLKSLEVHADCMMNNQRDLSLVTNWSIIEYSGLYVCVNHFKVLDEDGSISSLCLERVLKGMTVQLYSDGMHREQSSTYHHEVLQCLKHMVISDMHCGKKTDKKLMGIMIMMAEASIKVMKPNGHQPLKADSDDIGIDDLLTELAYLLNTPNLAFRKVDITFDMMLTYPQSIFDWFKTHQGNLPDFTSVQLSKSHYYVMRDDFSETSSYLMFYAGNMGGGHGHIDLLHFDFYKHGRTILGDTGRYTYKEEALERRYFKEASAHNTLIIDDQSFTEYKNTWGYGFVAAPKGQFFESTDFYDYAEASHDGYKTLQAPMIHTRKILYVKNWGHIIFDVLEGIGSHTVSRFFNFTSDQVRLHEHGAVTTYGHMDVAFEMDTKAELILEDAFFSEQYNDKQASKRLIAKDIISDKAVLPMIITSVDDHIKISRHEIYDLEGNIVDKDQGLAIKLSKGNESVIITQIIHQNKQTNLYKVEDTVFVGEYVLIFNHGGECRIVHYR